MFRVCPSYFCEGRGHFVGTTGEDSCWGSDPEMFPRHSLISLGFAPFTIRVQQDFQFCLNHRSAKEYRRNHKSAHFLRSQQSIIFLGLIKVDGKLLDVTAFPKMIDHHGFFLNRHCKLDQRGPENLTRWQGSFQNLSTYLLRQKSQNICEGREIQQPCDFPCHS